MTERRYLRRKGIEEFVKIAHEIYYIQNKVDELPFLDRVYFNKTGKYLMKRYEPWDWLVLEKQLEAYNCAFEELKEFQKLHRYQKIVKYLQR